MILSINLTKEEMELADAYSKSVGIPLSEHMKKIYFEKIEDEYDMLAADKALKEYEENPKTYTLDEIRKMFDI